MQPTHGGSHLWKEYSPVNTPMSCWKIRWKLQAVSAGKISGNFEVWLTNLSYYGWLHIVGLKQQNSYGIEEYWILQDATYVDISWNQPCMPSATANFWGRRGISSSRPPPEQRDARILQMCKNGWQWTYVCSHGRMNWVSTGNTSLDRPYSNYGNIGTWGYFMGPIPW